LWIQPAAGDAGGALGVALSLWHRYLEQPRFSPESNGTWERPSNPTPHAALPRYADGMNGALLGPAFSDQEIAAFLAKGGYPARKVPRRELATEIASLLAREKVIGLFQGRMEFGPRALGARSIIGDARSANMQSLMNLKIKFRESFRPFAPAVLREHLSEWFDLDTDSPYMLLVADVAPDRRLTEPVEEGSLWGIEKLNVPRSTVPAVTHVDYSARVQTVRRDTNGFFYDIIEACFKLTGCPVIVNTSFNVRGEPIVCTPADAYRCFMRTNMDVLVLESFVLEKSAQPACPDDTGWREQFVLD
jgi:carbamoyltransferase